MKLLSKFAFWLWQLGWCGQLSELPWDWLGLAKIIILIPLLFVCCKRPCFLGGFEGFSGLSVYLWEGLSFYFVIFQCYAYAVASKTLFLIFFCYSFASYHTSLHHSYNMGSSIWTWPRFGKILIIFKTCYDFLFLRVLELQQQTLWFPSLPCLAKLQTLKTQLCLDYLSFVLLLLY